MERYTLGIDIGGTYTDCAVLDCENNRVVATAKALTTKPSCGKGLQEALAQLPEAVYRRIAEVHLAGTVTTNAVIEKWNDTVHVVLTEPAVLPPLPNCVPVFFQNIFSEDGRLCNLDSALARETMAGLFQAKTVLVVSLDEEGREKEQALAAYLRQRLRGIPVFVAGEMARELLAEERLRTAYFNTALSPIVQKWFAEVAESLRCCGIDVPIRHITSDGRLVQSREMVTCPLETVLTGPVCSCMGSRYLSGKDTYLLMDIGGTSTDITFIRNGQYRMNENRIRVGEYLFSISAAEMQSYGVGGDSLLWLDHKKELRVGPRQVAALARLAERFPHITQELETYRRWSGYELLNTYDTDCFWASAQSLDGLGVDARDSAVIRYLKESGAHSVWHLAEVFGSDPDALDLYRLVRMGYLRAASLTPTDILCGSGQLSSKGRAASLAAIRRTAAEMGLSQDGFIREACRAVERQLTATCLQSTVSFEQRSYVFSESRAAWFLMQKFLREDEADLAARMTLRHPIVAVGAPAAAWIPAVAEKLGTKIYIPKHYEVAGAIGAAICLDE